MTTNESHARPTSEDENTHEEDVQDETPAPEAELPTASDASESGDEIVLPDFTALNEAYGDLPPLPEFDIDAALAAVSSLDAVLAEQEAEAAAEQARIAMLEAERQAQIEAQERAAEERRRWIESYYFPRPPMIVLKRGGLASTIPALLLIVSGAYLTFALTLSDTPPSPGLVTLIVSAVIGITLIANWLSSGRWARGSLFAGLTMLFGGAAIFAVTQPGLLPIVETARWPLFIVALGVAAVLAALLSRPVSGRIVALGLGITAAGVFTTAASAGLICACVPEFINTSWPVVAVVMLVFALIPLIFKRRTT